MKNIWENKLFAIGMLMFFGTKLITNLPYLNKFSGSPIDEFFSGAGTGLILVGLISFMFGDRLRALKGKG